MHIAVPRGMFEGAWRRIRGADQALVVGWAGLLVILGVALVARERGELTRLVPLIRRADTGWFLSAVAVELAVLVLVAEKYRLLLRRLGHAAGLRPLVEAALRKQVVATVVPLGGPPSMAVFVRDLGRRGVPAGDGLFATVLYSVLGNVSFVLFLLPVLAWLAIDREATGLILLAATLLVVVAAAAAAAVWLLVRGAGPPAWIGRRLPARVASLVAGARGHALRPADLLSPLAIAIVVDLAGALMLFACLQAVGQDASLATAAGGYAVGTVFLLISPVFQGIGVVELSMAVALGQLGVPGAAALGATLLYRFCELWLPLFLGVAVQPAARRGARGLPPRLPALFTGATGLLIVLSVLAPAIPRRVDTVERSWPLAVPDASRTVALVAGFFLLFLSSSLLRRKRVAWLAAIGLLAAAFVAGLTRRHDGPVAVVAAVNLALLLLYRRRFRVRSDLPTMGEGLVRFASSLLFALVYGTLGFWLLDRREFGIDFSLGDALGKTLRLFFGAGDAGLTPRTRYAAWFLDSFTVVGVVAFGYAVFSLARPVVWRRQTLPAERARARRLIERYGDSSLDAFKYAPDKLYFFSESARGEGVVAYGLAHSTAIALGDPAATDEEAFRRTLDEFLDFCDANGWRAAFHQCPPTHLADYAAAGLAACKIGEDAVVDLTRFTMQGGKMKSLRSTINRLERDGVKAVFREPPHDAAILAQLRGVSDEWLTIPGRRERGFTLGRRDDDVVRASPLMTVEDAAGEIQAFANLIHDGVEGEATIDLMRHRVGAPRGSMDLLFVRLMEHLKAQGYTSFSLGMVPFAEVGTGPASPALERAIHVLAEHLTRFFSYKGLRAYKDKFGPTWEPRYLVYQSELALPLVTLALVRLTESA